MSVEPPTVSCQSIESIWASFNSIAEKISRANCATSSGPPAVSDADIEAFSEEVMRVVKAAEHLGDSEEEEGEAERGGGVPPQPASVSDCTRPTCDGKRQERLDKAHVADLVRLVDELRSMAAVHRYRKIKSETSSPTGDTSGIVGSHGIEESCNEEDGDDSDLLQCESEEKREKLRENAKRRRAAKADAEARRDMAEEERHRAVVEEVMAHMSAFLPSVCGVSAECENPGDTLSLDREGDRAIDEGTFAMAEELLKDSDVRGSFVELRDQLVPWLERTSNRGHHSDSEWLRYETQLSVARQLCELFSSPECLEIVTSSASLWGSGKKEHVAAVVRFNDLMTELTALGEAPAGMYSK